MPSLRLLTVPAVAAVAAAVAVPASASPATHTAPATVHAGAAALPSVVPTIVGKQAAKGATDRAQRVDFSVYVAGQDDAAMRAYAVAVSDPASPTFRKFLTPARFAATFGPAQASTRAVVAGLQAFGATVDGTTADGRMVTAHATVGTLTDALGVAFEDYAYRGQTFRVATTNPVLPAAMRPLVSAVTGLTTVDVKAMNTGLRSTTSDTPPVPPVTTPAGGVTYAPAAAFYPGSPCSTYYGEKTSDAQPTYLGIHPVRTICGYNPNQIRAAYRIPQTGLDGTGVHIAIVDDYSLPTMVADTNTFSNKYGIPPLATGQYVDHSDATVENTPEVDVDDQGVLFGTLPAESPQGWSGEQALDVEMVHLMAPKATIDYYGGRQGLGLQPLEEAFTHVVSDVTAGLTQVTYVSDSWGTDEQSPLITPADVQALSDEVDQAATVGLGASFSSGDDGDQVESTGYRAASFPSTIPAATSVGGTTLEVGAGNTYVGETYWGTRLEPLTADGKGWDPTPVAGGEGLGKPTGPGSLAGAGGGGVSSNFDEPDYQKGVVPTAYTNQASNATNGTDTIAVTGGRVVPDISLVGDSTTGVLVGQTQTQKDGTASYSEFRIGGTSVSSPLWAGLMALAIQQNGGTGLGSVNASLYKAFGKTATAFRDPSLGRGLTNVRTDFSNPQDPASTPVYALRIMGQLSTLHDAVGYDDSTGLGTPCASTFVPALVTPTADAGIAPGCGAAITGDPAATLPDSSVPVVLPVAAVGLVGLLVAARRRRQRA